MSSALSEIQEYEVWRQRFAQRAPFQLDPEVTRVAAMRGADFIFPLILSGNGFGPFYEDTTGNVFLDLISSIGVHILGCSHPVLKTETSIGQSGLVMQTHLFPQKEYAALITDLTDIARHRLALDRCWLVPTGSAALEAGVQIGLACHPPKKRKVITFRETYFASSVMKRSAFLSSPVPPLKFFTFPKAGDLQAIGRCLSELEAMSEVLRDEIGAFVFEPFIAEGGFWNADADTLSELLKVLKSNQITIISDETQTFLKSPDLFASSQPPIKNFVDVVIVGKALQNAAVIFRRELTSTTGILSGTFAGSTAALHNGREVLKFLVQNEFYGDSGRIAQISSRMVRGLQSISPAKLQLVDIDSCGLLIGFSLSSGDAFAALSFVRRLFAAGLLVSVCGQNPARIRFHLPAIIQDLEIDLALKIIETELRSFSA